MTWFCKSRAARARVREIGGKKHIGCRLGPWSYGKPMPRNYNWGWRHGYLAAGFVQMTPRNDFHSNPSKVSRHFAAYAGYDGYPFWVDEKTLPRKGVTSWYTRERDFYWTMDQASFRLVRAEEATLLVELGHSMPFFERYVLRIDGREVASVRNPFPWRLKKGLNKLEVAPLDLFGRRGAASSVTLTYGEGRR